MFPIKIHTFQIKLNTYCKKYHNIFLFQKKSNNFPPLNPEYFTMKKQILKNSKLFLFGLFLLAGLNSLKAQDLLITVEVCDPATEVRMVGPTWNNWDPVSGPIGVDNLDGTWTFTISPAPVSNLEYLFVADGVYENLISDMQQGGTCAPLTNYSSYANREWVVGSGDVTDVYYGRCVPCDYPDFTITTEVCDPATTVKLTGPLWAWNLTYGPSAVDNGDGTWTFSFSPAPIDTFIYLLVVDGVQENLIQDMLDGGTCAPNTDYATYANRRWVLVDGDIENTHDRCTTCDAGINEENLFDLVVFPNPAGNQITLTGEKPFESYKITNLVGEILMVKETCQMIENIDISKLSSGMYLIQVESGNETQVITFKKN